MRASPPALGSASKRSPMAYTIPDARDPIPTPLSVYGNNATVACPCGRVVVVRSMNESGTGSWQCSCTRWYKGYPENGAAITHILGLGAWQPGREPDLPHHRRGTATSLVARGMKLLLIDELRHGPKLAGVPLEPTLSPRPMGRAFGDDHIHGEEARTLRRGLVLVPVRLPKARQVKPGRWGVCRR